MGSAQTTSRAFDDFAKRHTLLKKTQDPISGLQAEIYSTPARPNEPIILLTEEFDEKSSEAFANFKKKVNERKQFHPNITNLVFVDNHEQSTYCYEKITTHVAFEFSDASIATAPERLSSSSRVKDLKTTPPHAVREFLGQTLAGVEFLASKKGFAGFVKPAQILVLSPNKLEKIYKIVEFSPLNRTPHMYARMLVEKEYYAPLDPYLMKAFREKKREVNYNTGCDVWALGVSALCFIFNKDFSYYYDWQKEEIKIEKIKQDIQLLQTSGYDPAVVKVLMAMLEPDASKRLGPGSLMMMIK